MTNFEIKKEIKNIVNEVESPHMYNIYIKKGINNEKELKVVSLIKIKYVDQKENIRLVKNKTEYKPKRELSYSGYARMIAREIRQSDNKKAKLLEERNRIFNDNKIKSKEILWEAIVRLL